MPRFEKGHTGRPKGTEGNIKGQLKDLFADLVEDILGQYDTLDIKQKLGLLYQIMPYVVAKPAIEQKASEDTEDKPKQTMIIGGKEIEF